ncbi:MAG: 4-alpha-glucanotransferase [Geobacteraceae bacterium]
MQRVRKSGILLHPTSLPGPGGIGSVGAAARSFIDFLQASGQTLWQVLPLGYTSYGNSPYMCYSALAGNPLLIDLECLVAEGDLNAHVLRGDFPSERVNYQKVIEFKQDALRTAAATFFAGGKNARMEDFWHFCDTTPWLDDFGLFMALKEQYPGLAWCDWPETLVCRDPAALEAAAEELGTRIGEHKYQQWQFFRQWHQLREYATQQGVGIFGDIPIFVAYDSVDVWANPRLFLLDKTGRPTVVAGVPPDYFSKTGQLWGNPLYDWDAMAQDGYAWWFDRVRASLDLYDLIRIDHFRGFAACWEVPYGEKTAINGRWQPGPGEALFSVLAAVLGDLPIVAEDLGVITPDVEALRDQFSFPGMKILQFAFGSGPNNPYLPHNHERNSVVYTGTHDNDTTLGWFTTLSAREKKLVLRYLDRSPDEIVWDLIRTALASVADTCILPLQDLLELPGDSRMNLPGIAGGNWSWRFGDGALTDKLAKRLLGLTEIYGRARKL